MIRILVAIIFGILTQLVFVDICQAEEQDSGLVEIHYPVDSAVSYKERRRTHGTNVGFNLTQMIPYNWESLIDDEYYGDVYGQTPIMLMTLEGGYKFNFVLGSLNFLAGIGFGQATADLSGVTRFINVTKYLVKGMYILDDIFPEPYLAPYIGGSVWQMRVTESEQDSDFGGTRTTGYGFEYSVGALIQLNWLEPDTARETLAESGLENTYLDLFVSQHFRTQQSDDPSTSTDINYGAGLRLEF